MSSSKQRLQALNIILSLLMISTLGVTANTISVEAAAKMQDLNYAAVNNYVDLKYLVEHLEEFEGVCVTTNGTVRYYGSFFMFEDFWLQAQNHDAKIPVVTRFAGLAVPPNMSEMEVTGTIEYSTLEGGFYFLKASSWRALITVPEEPPIATPTPTASPTQSYPPNPSPSFSPSPSQNPTETPFSSQAELYGKAAILLLAVIALLTIAFSFLRKKQR